MTTTRSAITTPAKFRSRSEALLRRSHSDASDLTIDWTRCERVKWFDGTSGFSGSVTIAATGYRTREMTATYCSGALMVR
jgi:hypothetical protein